ncbi:hypothetical protein AAHA92_20786 [Salvia divinorum]|uniref:Uncharacterized protein n=1 Tax=Salvia divinorum TaxID=28513 RepID=A0ABD1GIB2_SALDI
MTVWRDLLARCSTKCTCSKITRGKLKPHHFLHAIASTLHCIGLNGLNVPDASLVPVKCTQDVLGATAFVYLIERCFEMLPKLLTKDIFLCVKM